MIKLNIGGGYKRYDGFLNVDRDINCKPDVLLDLEKDKFPFEDSTVSEIKAYHILEHIGEGYIPLLQELYRICEHGAIIDIKVPHHFHDNFYSDPTHKRPITVEGFRLFNQTANRLEIARQGTSSTLGIMYGINFEVVHYDFIYDSFYHDIIKNSNREQLERLMREATNVAVETQIKVMVIKDNA